MQTARVKIVDATLREGNQAIGVKFTVDQSLQIAAALDRLGVDMIEIGHPLAGPNEHQRTKAVAEAGLSAEIIAHARALPADVKAVADAGASWVGIFLGVNSITSTARVVGRGFPELIAIMRDAIHAAKDCGLKVRYSCEDASRTEDGFLLDAFSAAVDAGADRICFADTVGHLEPAEVAAQVTKMLKAFPTVETEVHLHDDRGLAMASSIAAIDAGVHSVSTSVNGLGERCGITELCSLLVNLGFRKYKDLPSIEQLRALSDLVGEYSGCSVDSMRPIVGRNAFAHGSKLHIRASSYDPKAYDWIASFVHSQSKHSGTQ